MRFATNHSLDSQEIGLWDPSAIAPDEPPVAPPATARVSWFWWHKPGCRSALLGHQSHSWAPRHTHGSTVCLGTVNPHRWRSRSREITARSCTTSNASADPTGAFIVSRTCRHIQGLSRSENLAANHRPRRIADLCVRTAHSLFLAEC